MHQFLYIATAMFSVHVPVEIRDVNLPSSLDHWASGQISESDYRSMAENINNYIESNGKAPNYATSSLKYLTKC